MTTAKNKLTKLLYLFEKVILLVFVFMMLLISKSIGEYVRDGIKLCFNVIIGSVFPFFIFSDLVLSKLQRGRNKLLNSLFKKLFHINGAAFFTFICGTLCGFPLGARLADDMYNDGLISEDEFVRLVAISTCSSPSFVISGIGAAMRGSIKDGIIIYLSSLGATITVSLLFAKGKKATVIRTDTELRKFDLTNTIKKATTSTLNVCGFVIAFSVICGLINSIPVFDGLKLFILPFLEISNAAKIFSETASLSYTASMMMTSFSVTLTGVCAMLQVKSFITNKNFPMKSFFLMKLFAVTISAIITLLTVIIF